MNLQFMVKPEVRKINMIHDFVLWSDIFSYLYVYTFDHFVKYEFYFSLWIYTSLNGILGDIEKQDIRNICLANSATTHTILRNNLTLLKANVNIISCPADLIEGSGRAMILLPNDTKICISDALYSSRSRRIYLVSKIYGVIDIT